MNCQTSHGHHHGAHHSQEAAMAEMLDLDARLMHEHLREIFQSVARQQQTPGTIVDLGAGTGTGTFGLAHTYPQAKVVAVDQSEYMLDLLTSEIAQQRLSDRVSTLQCDLDTSWPDLAEIDLVWAASSMHHMSDPNHVLSQINDMLSPEGLLVVVEMDALPRHLPDELGFGAPGLEQRLHDAAALAGGNSHPNWAPSIQAAGMEITDQRTFSYETNENQELIAKNALSFMSRMRTRFEDTLSAEDIAAIDDLLDQDGPCALTKRTDLSTRGSRTVWTARSTRKHT